MPPQCEASADKRFCINILLSIKCESVYTDVLLTANCHGLIIAPSVIEPWYFVFDEHN